MERIVRSLAAPPPRSGCDLSGGERGARDQVATTNPDFGWRRTFDGWLGRVSGFTTLIIFRLRPRLDNMRSDDTVTLIKTRASAYSAGYFRKERGHQLQPSVDLQESYLQGVRDRAVDDASDHMVVGTSRRTRL